VIEPEIDFADSPTMPDIAEDFLKYLVRSVLAERGRDRVSSRSTSIKTCSQRLETSQARLKRMDYSDANQGVEAALSTKGHKNLSPG